MKLLQHHSVAILLLALLLILPAILSPPMTHDSFWIDWVWADQFTGELAKGNFYPRWLPQSHGGLGSPVFYYYPPLAFYVTGLFGLVGLSTYASIVAAFFAGFVASGFAMFAWLKDRAKSPLFGALLFMAAPYHVLDFYGRGALAEFVAITFIPLVALGLTRSIQGRFVLGALAYAGLILSHLPLALLASLFFIAPYGLYLSRHEPRRLLQIAVPILLGLALAAVYLLPAIALDSYRDSARLWQHAALKPANWTLLEWDMPGAPSALKLLVLTLMLVLLQPIVVLLFTARRWWGLYAGLCCVMAGALIPPIWQLPLLQSVQFPYRMFPLAEFAIATGIASLTLSRALVLAATFPLLALSTFFLAGERLRTAPDVSWSLIAQRADVPENLPPGERPTSWPSQWALELARSHQITRQIGDRTVEPVFYFPAWEVRCQGVPVPTAPDPETKLLTYRGSECERRLKLTVPEQIGAALSLGAILLLIGLAGLVKRRPRATTADGALLV